MENTKNILTEEDKLFLALEYYRLNKDLEIIEDKIKENSPTDNSQEENKFNKFWKDNIVNPIKNYKVNNLTDDRKKILDNIDDFKEKHGELDKSEDELKEMVKNFLKEDNLEARTLIGLKIALESNYKFHNEKESLAKVSNIVFDDSNRLEEIKEELKKNYYAINRKNLNELDKNVWKGLGIVAAASILGGPIGTAAVAMNKNVTDNLKDLTNAGKVTGIAALTLSAVTLNVFLIGATAGVVGLSELRKDENLKEEFRNVSPDSLAMRFAIKATILEELKKKGEKEVLNQYLDDALQVLDNYRADAEYMLIVEHKEEDAVRRKITICNNLIGRLSEISK